MSDTPAIRCQNCGVIIMQYETIIEDDHIIWAGYRNTIEHINSGDSTRCGKCYQKYAFGGYKDEPKTKEYENTLTRPMSGCDILSWGSL